MIGLSVEDYVVFEIINITSTYYDNKKKYQVTKLVRNEYFMINECLPELCNMKHINWCVAKDDVSPQEIFVLTNGTNDMRYTVVKYCFQDTMLPYYLYKKTDMLLGIVELSKICDVPIDFILFRGQGIKLTSIVSKTCREKHIFMIDLNKTPNNGYGGATVLTPTCGMYDANPVAVSDYQSLYPSIAAGYGLSPDSKNYSKSYDLNNNVIKSITDLDIPLTENEISLGYRTIETKFDTFTRIGKKKVVSGYRICKWVQFINNEHAIVPIVVLDLLKARSTTRAIMKTIDDPFMYNIYEQRQLGYKQASNSVYGQMGSPVSTFYEIDVASSITSIGRLMIMYAKAIAEEIYGNSIFISKTHGPVRTRSCCIYGDTDSVFYTFNLEHVDTGESIRGLVALEITIEIAIESSKLASLFLPPPMGLAYEKTFLNFILLSKKRYVGTLFEKNIYSGYFKYMGLQLKKKDVCDYLKDVYGYIIKLFVPDKIIERTTDELITYNKLRITHIIEYLTMVMDELIKGNVPIEKLTITKSVKSNYKSPPAQFYLAQRIAERDPGNAPKSGDRLKYVFFVNNTIAASEKKTKDCIETVDFILKNSFKIDYTYYITNQLMKPLQQLLGLALCDIYSHFNQQSKLLAYKKYVHKNKEITTDDNGDDMVKSLDKHQSTCVKSILFDPYLTRIYNTQNKIATIDSFFTKK